jgi:hypothetical protein
MVEGELVTVSEHSEAREDHGRWRGIRDMNFGVDKKRHYKIKGRLLTT